MKKSDEDELGRASRREENDLRKVEKGKEFTQSNSEKTRDLEMIYRAKRMSDERCVRGKIR